MSEHGRIIVSSLKKALILLGADINLASSQEEKIYFEQLINYLHRGIKLFYRDIEHGFPNEILMKIIFQYLLLQYPELNFIKSILPEIIELRLGIWQKESSMLIAVPFINQWIENKGIILSKKEKQESINTLSHCLNQARENNNNFPSSFKQEFKKELNEQIVMLDEISETSVTEAIQKTVENYRAKQMTTKGYSHDDLKNDKIKESDFVETEITFNNLNSSNSITQQTLEANKKRGLFASSFDEIEQQTKKLKTSDDSKKIAGLSS